MTTKLSNDVQAVIFRRAEAGPEFLLLKRFDKEKGVDQYRLVKGGVKAKYGEDHDGALRREITEETGVASFEVLGELAPYGYDAGEVRHEVRAFLVEAAEAGDIEKVDQAEEGGFTIKEVRWAAPAEALELLSFPQERALVEEAVPKL